MDDKVNYNDHLGKLGLQLNVVFVGQCRVLLWFTIITEAAMDLSNRNLYILSTPLWSSGRGKWFL